MITKIVGPSAIFHTVKYYSLKIFGLGYRIISFVVVVFKKTLLGNSDSLGIGMQTLAAVELFCLLFLSEASLLSMDESDGTSSEKKVSACIFPCKKMKMGNVSY